MEQHLSVCPLEPVACEMKEFGCSVVVPRKELARHMRESELQHLTAMAVMNLRLTRQLQQEMSEQKKLLTEMQTEMKMKMDEQKRELTDHIQQVQLTTHHIEQHTACGVCSGSEVFTFTQYSKRKGSGTHVESNPFYSHHHGYKFKLKIVYHHNHMYNSIAAYLSLMQGEYDEYLSWPVGISFQLELLNQAGDHHHVVRTIKTGWMKGGSGTGVAIDSLMKYTDLEKRSDGVQYMMNDCLKIRIHITIVRD